MKSLMWIKPKMPGTPPRWMGWLVLFMGLTVLQGCGTLSNGQGWGASATIAPGWNKIGRSALDAVKSPGVWLPMAGALALQVQDFDSRISTWAADQTPVFGSRDNAATQSDSLENIATGAFALTLLATPGGDQPEAWLLSKTKGLAVEYAAIRITKLATSSLKAATLRQDPNKDGYDSMPSEHSSNVALLKTLSIRNLKTVPMPRALRWSAEAGLHALALGTDWARVEAFDHYPSDILVSMSLGNFMGAFIYDAFMGIESDGSVQPQISIGPSAAFLGVRVRF